MKGLLKLTVILLTALSTSAQSSSDSILFSIADTAFNLAFENADSAYIMAQEAYTRSLSEDHADRARANTLNAIAWSLFHMGKFDSSIVLFRQSEQLFDSLGYHTHRVRVIINMTEAHLKKKDFAAALNDLLEADSIAHTASDLIQQSNVKRLIAIVYREMDDIDLALKYFTDATDGFRKAGHILYATSSTISTAILYRRKHMHDTSIALLNRIIRSGEMKDNAYMTAMVNENLGETYFEMGRYLNAVMSFRRSAEIFRKLGNAGDLAYEYLYLGKSFARKNDSDSARHYLNLARMLYHDINTPHYHQEVYEELSQVYAIRKQWDSAHHYLSLANTLSDTIRQVQQRRLAEEMKEKYERQIRDNEITLLKTEQDLMLERDNRQKRLLWFLCFAMIVSAIIVVQWLSRIRLKRRLHLEQLRRQISRDLHDDIGSTLSSIEVSSAIAQRKADSPEYTREMFGKINSYSREVMENMSDIVWATNPQYDSFESLGARLREYAIDKCELQEVALDFRMPEDVQQISLAAHQRKHLYLFVKEAINNALKHSKCRQLTVQFIRTDSKGMVIEIADDGTGFDSGNTFSGNGLNNLKNRAVRLHGSLEINSAEGTGTTIRLTLN